jgi:hypothetical protein
MNQKSVFTLAIEAKRETQQKGQDQAHETRTQSKAEEIQEKNKHKVSAYALWCDWGIAPSSDHRTTVNSGNLGTSSTTSSSYTSMVKENVEFSIYIPTGARSGDTIEVTLPDGVNKVITYIDPLALRSRIQDISICFGRDGVFFTLPPAAGHDFNLLAEAKNRETEVEMALEMAKSVPTIGDTSDYSDSDV